MLRQPSDRNFIEIPVKLLYKEWGVLGLVLATGFRRAYQLLKQEKSLSFSGKRNPELGSLGLGW